MKKERELKQLKILSKNTGEMRLAAENWKSDFQILISTILSARTRDEVTIPVSEKLFKKFPNSKKLAKSNVSEIQKIIHPVNFFRNKSKNIITCAKTLDSNFKGKIPRTIDELILLPGVGRKTENVFF